MIIQRLFRSVVFSATAICLATNGVSPSVAQAQTSAPKAAPSSATDNPEALAEVYRLLTMARLKQKTDPAAAKELLQLALAVDGFWQLPSNVVLATIAPIASQEFIQGDFDAAFAHLDTAHPYLAEDSLELYWRLRLQGVLLMDDDRRTVADLALVATDFPGVLPGSIADSVAEAAWHVEDTSPQAKELRELLTGLAAGGRMVENTMSVDINDLWFFLFKLDVSQGETDAARALLPRIFSQDAFIRIQIDRKYESFWIAEPKAAFVARQNEILQHFYDRWEGDSSHLYSSVLMAWALRQANEAKASLEVLADVTAEPPLTSYDDYVDQSAWALNAAAISSFDLGETDSALRLQLLAVEQSQKAGDDISQNLNLAEMYIEVGDLTAARGWIDRANGGSEYGQLVKTVLQACIDARSGDLAGWRQQQDILEKGIDVSYRPALGGAKCGASDSELAALIVRLLDDEKTRSQMLFDLQDFIVTGPKTPARQQQQEKWDRVVKRSEVTEKIAQFGRRLSWPFVPL